MDFSFKLFMSFSSTASNFLENYLKVKRLQFTLTVDFYFSLAELGAWGEVLITPGEASLVAVSESVTVIFLYFKH